MLRVRLQDASPRGAKGSAPAGVGVALGLLCSASLVHCEPQGCPSECLCAGDVFACSGRNMSTIPAYGLDLAFRLDFSYNHIAAVPTDWTPNPLGKLEMLVLSHNIISHVSPKALCMVPLLRHLDLSSNRMRAVSGSMLCGLKHLEVLLLYDNQISKISRQGFAGLSSLRKVYLSWNALMEFPAAILEGEFSVPGLDFLDLSNNLLMNVPVQEVISLPTRKQAGIYLHGNPLACDCMLHALLQSWSGRKFLPALDFRGDYRCFIPGLSVDVSLFSLNCSGSAMHTPAVYTGSVTEVRTGTALVLPCGNDPPWTRTPVLWITPDRGTLWTGDRMEAVRVFTNGSLGLAAARLEDSGTYTCVASSVMGNLSWSVEVAVTECDSSVETFSTALTTLGSCGVSLVLVLLYLYLTPCRCWGQKSRHQNQYSGHTFTLGNAHCKDNEQILCGTTSNAPSKRTSSLGKRTELLGCGSGQDQGKRVPKLEDSTLG